MSVEGGVRLGEVGLEAEVVSRGEAGGTTDMAVEEEEMMKGIMVWREGGGGVPALMNGEGEIKWFIDYIPKRRKKTVFRILS